MFKCECCQTVEIPDPIHTYDRTDAMCIECSNLIDRATQAISAARQIGVPKYGEETWKEQSVETHIDHAATHIYLWRRGNTDEDQLAHAICRLVMAKEKLSYEVSRRESLGPGAEDSSPGKPAAS